MPPDDFCEFEAVLETLKDDEKVDLETDLEIGENDKLDMLIVMGNLSGLADKSTELVVSTVTLVSIFFILFFHTCRITK